MRLKRLLVIQMWIKCQSLPKLFHEPSIIMNNHEFGQRLKFFKVIIEKSIIKLIFKWFF